MGRISYAAGSNHAHTW